MVATCKAYPEEYWFNRTNASFMNIKKCILAVIAVWLMSFHLAASETVAYKVETVSNVRLQDSREYVSDPASLLTAATHDSINAMFSRLESSTGIEAAVVMLPSIGEADPFSFSVDLFRRWGIGKKKNDNGLLVLYVEDQHNIRFTTGYGIEGTLTDALSKRIQMRYMVPAFKDGDRDRGMLQGCKAVAGVLDGSMQPDETEDEYDFIGGLVIAMIIWAAILMMVVLSRRKRKCPQCKKRKLVLRSSREHIVNGRHYRKSVYQCSHCGKVVEEDRRADDDDDGALLTGMTIGSILGSSRGGGFSGGSFGGGSTGGGGAGSSW